MTVGRRTLLSFFFCLVGTLRLTAGQEGARVENVRAAVERDTVYITYDLHAGSEDDLFDVQVDVRRKGAPDFRYTLRDAKGAIGPDQRPGRRKLIIWDPRTAAKLWPADDDFVFEIYVTQTPGGWGKWPWIGGGVAVVAAVVVWLLCDDPPLEDVFPSPPNPPPGP